MERYLVKNGLKYGAGGSKDEKDARIKNLAESASCRE